MNLYINIIIIVIIINVLAAVCRQLQCGISSTAPPFKQFNPLGR